MQWPRSNLAARRRDLARDKARACCVHLVGHRQTPPEPVSSRQEIADKPSRASDTATLAG